VKQVQWAG